VAESLVASGQVGTVVRLDRLAAAHPDVVGDAEALPLRENTFDLIVSVLALQWVDDLPGALSQILRALKPDGLFMAALAGGETLRELRSALAGAESEVRGGASPRVAPFADVRSLGALLQRAGFALPVADQDRLTVRYASAVALNARSPRHGRDQRAPRARPPPVATRDHRPHRRAVRRGTRRYRRQGRRDIRHRLAVGLVTARLAAARAEAGISEGPPGRCTGCPGEIGGREDRPKIVDGAARLLRAGEASETGRASG